MMILILLKITLHNLSSVIFLNEVSFVLVLHKDEKILGQKHIYLPHAQTAIYDSD